MAKKKTEENNQNTTTLTPEQEKRRQAFFAAVKEVNKECASKRKTKNNDMLVGLISDMNVEVEKFSSGSLVLDNILGGGFPRGRIIELFGPEASGKTSIALTTIGNVQKKGGNALFVDVEQALDIVYARKLGVNIEELAISQPTVAEEAFNIMYQMMRTKTVDIIVLDSVAALVPKAEYEKEVGAVSVGILAKFMSENLRKLISLANECDVTIIFLNQVRDKIGLFAGIETPGGKALKFFASQRVVVRKKSQPVKDDATVIGTEVTMKVVKNKVAPPFGEGTTVLTFAEGINTGAEALTIGEQLGIIVAEGRTYYYPNGTKELISDDTLASWDTMKSGRECIKIGVNKKPVIEELKTNKALYKAISEEIASKLKENIATGVNIVESEDVSE